MSETQDSRKNIESAFNASRQGIPEHIIVMVIAYDQQQGQVQVQGPIGNKHISYAILELAKDCIRQYNQENIPGVIKP